MPWLRLVVILTWTSFSLRRLGTFVSESNGILLTVRVCYKIGRNAPVERRYCKWQDKIRLLLLAIYIDISKQSLTHRAVRRNSTTICVWMHPWRGIVLGWQVLQNTVNCEIFCTDNDFYILYMKDRELGPECVGIFTELYLIINYSKSAWRILFIEMFIARICRIIKLSVAGWDDINLQCLCQQMCLHIRYGTFFTLKP